MAIEPVNIRTDFTLFVNKNTRIDKSESEIMTKNKIKLKVKRRKVHVTFLLLLQLYPVFAFATICFVFLAVLCLWLSSIRSYQILTVFMYKKSSRNKVRN